MGFGEVQGLQPLIHLTMVFPRSDPACAEINYSRQDFEEAFGRRYTIEGSVTVQDSARQLYLMRLHQTEP